MPPDQVKVCEQCVPSLCIVSFVSCDHVVLQLRQVSALRIDVSREHAAPELPEVETLWIGGSCDRAALEPVKVGSQRICGGVAQYPTLARDLLRGFRQRREQYV